MKMKKQEPLWDENEWAFQTLPKEEECDCAHYEMARHRGEDNPPWLALSDAERATLRDQLNAPSPFGEIPPNNAAFLATVSSAVACVGDQQPVKYFIVKADFSAKDSALSEAFQQWLDGHPERKQWQSSRKPVHHHPWRKWLLDLAIWRANARMGRKEAIEVMWELFTKWGVAIVKGGRLGPMPSDVPNGIEAHQNLKRVPSGGSSTKGNPIPWKRASPCPIVTGVWAIQIL